MTPLSDHEPTAGRSALPGSGFLRPGAAAGGQEGQRLLERGSARISKQGEACPLTGV